MKHKAIIFLPLAAVIVAMLPSCNQNPGTPPAATNSPDATPSNWNNTNLPSTNLPPMPSTNSVGTNTVGSN